MANGNVGGILSSPVAQSYNSFSGADIIATIGSLQFAELQAVSYNITREKAPIYTMGSSEPRSFSRNKRGIAGTLIWVNFDRHALLNIIYQSGGQFVSDIEDIRPLYQSDANNNLSQTAIYNATLGPSTGFTSVTGLNATSTIDQLDNVPIDSVSSLKALASPWYSDQILPFDITLAAVNEYGASAASRIYGVEILNEGWGNSIDDAVNEMQATFVARSVEPWMVVTSAFAPNIGGDAVLQG
jgi:hypothetical protein